MTLVATIAGLASVSAADANPPAHAAVHTGLASWYGEAHQGRRTASGDIFDQHALTAAHPSLPFGTLLRVTNVHNGKSVDVRVNDRGPVVPGRILDLSRAAARAIGAIGAGVVPVRFRVLSPSAPAR
jgi:peptidoglycan lytic transglycosylase